jgi:HK97 family phage portal protein
MGYGIYDGDIISTDNPKMGALTMSVDFQKYRPQGQISPENMWRTQTAIRAVVGFKVNALASVQFNLYKRGEDDGRTRVRTGPLAETLDMPSFRLGQARFLEQLQLDMSIYGRWAFTVNDTATGLEFLPLPAHRIALVVDGAGRYTDIAISTTEGWALRPLDNIVFDISRGPTTGGTKRFGYSDLETLTDLALELSGMAQYRRDLFTNSAMVPAVIERPKDAGSWSDTAWARFKSEISTYRAGGGKAGGWPILEDGMTLKPVTVFDPKSAQYVEVRELHLKEAAQALHIPPELVGAMEGTHSNIIALREQLYVDVLGTDIKFFEDAMNAGLKKLLRKGQYIEANLDSKLRGTLAERNKIYQGAVGAPYLTVNEVRAMENRPAIEGGDELVKPLNVTQGGQASPQDSAPPDNGQDIKDGQLARSTKAATFDPKVRFAGVNKATDAMNSAMLAWYDGFAQRVADLMGISKEPPPEPEEPAGKAIEKPYKPKEPQNNDLQLNQPGLNYDQMQAEQEALAQVMFEHAKNVALATGTMIYSGYSGELVPNFHKTDAWLEQMTKRNSEEFMDYYNRQVLKPTYLPYQQVWEDAIRAGIFELGRQQFETFATINATRSHTFAARDMAKQLDMNDTKTWWTTSKNPRDSHKAQSGVTVKTDDYFPNGCRFPGDWDGGAEEVINCQCRIDYQGRNPFEFTP